MAERECDNCGEKKQNKYLGKIRGKLLCKKCRQEVRINRRKDTIEKSGIKDKLRELKNKEAREKGYQRKAYAKKVGRPVRSYTRKGQVSPPIPKGSTSGRVKQKNKSESYLGFQESQELLRILMRRGLDFDESKEEIKKMKMELSKTRRKMKDKNKSEEEIKAKQQSLLEELYNS